MEQLRALRRHPELKNLVVDASLALARLDAARLKELALCCEGLTRDLAGAGTRGSH